MPRSTRPGARRADAQHSVEKILDAAIDCLSRNHDASVVQIAQAAGVGRVTLYGHFPSREGLVEAALAHLLERGEEVLSGLDLTGEPAQSLRELIDSSWLLIAQSGAMLEAAQKVLPPGRIHELHAGPEQRVRELIVRGQAQGAFRDDLPAAWLASALHHVLKGTAADVRSGAMTAEQAPEFIAQITLAAYAPQPSCSNRP
ncbi:TetR family transcriptional regulator [Streptomyces sp. CS149]|uniref:TetR/AcrR family transcriptional regulator n=2 Tax=Streptomyces TaxID=1883 RepID=A0A5D4JPZ7_9ACTN|nr:MULTISPECIES: TetR/AcrR family transcriptional regulator [Streptomyces]MBL1285589.1 TetR/AcrR family transcriptional regulator [Streptomyces silvae]PSK72859.1 TetR family transcriptional regulator [Streptomyces sp. CS149]PWS49228.1 TetR/AcrR family transcriptional regulator [Streptomyces sp. FT05W]TYR65693.1 TetR/AcrR family transcriptional regulator [Streptomyces parvus]WLQ66669.1 TetR/AcrR family transcriptional regulator [Streptomyces sp. Alt3]